MAHAVRADPNRDSESKAHAIEDAPLGSSPEKKIGSTSCGFARCAIAKHPVNDQPVTG